MAGVSYPNHQGKDPGQCGGKKKKREGKEQAKTDIDPHNLFGGAYHQLYTSEREEEMWTRWEV